MIDSLEAHVPLDVKVKPEINQNAKENQSNQSKSKSEIY
jgi:hypothetical protein